MQAADIFKALANDKRLQILAWLKDPRAHFPPQRDGDLVDDGVCAIFLADKLGVGASTLSEHMRLLVAAGLVTAKPIKQWTFYRRDPERAEEVAALLGQQI
jgi:DNA-binding transcriptional ArsR family regulator